MDRVDYPVKTQNVNLHLKEQHGKVVAKLHQNLLCLVDNWIFQSKNIFFVFMASTYSISEC
jgi:hypothetical protein